MLPERPCHVVCDDAIFVNCALQFIRRHAKLFSSVSAFLIFIDIDAQVLPFVARHRCCLHDVKQTCPIPGVPSNGGIPIDRDQAARDPRERMLRLQAAQRHKAAMKGR
jgi:hypothetical protein